MAIYLLTYNPPVPLPDATEESLELAGFFVKPSFSVIPADVHKDIVLKDESRKYALRTYQPPTRPWVDTVVEIKVYKLEATGTSGGAEQRESVNRKEELMKTIIVNESHPVEPMFHPEGQGIIVYESSKGKGDDLTVDG